MNGLKVPHQRKMGYNPHHAHRRPTHNVRLLPETLETDVDWRTKGAVTPVKNQGHCGSCWSFSATGAIEGAMFLKTGKLQSYSEQQLIDCSTVYMNDGCEGGFMTHAFQYAMDYPLELESAYPYKASDGTCSYAASKGQGKVADYDDVQADSASQLKAALSKRPVSIAIQADQTPFINYKSGVITSGCGTSLDHGVLAVGFGTLNGQEFFLVKNSWGADWGDKGYVRISTASSNVCGILSMPSYPTE